MSAPRTPRRPIRIHVPGLHRSVGAGQLIKKISSSVGISPCSGCNKRAAALDRRVKLVPRGSKG